MMFYRMLDKLYLFAVFVILMCVEGVIRVPVLGSWLVRGIAGITDDPNAGPYRQVR